MNFRSFSRFSALILGAFVVTSLLTSCGLGRMATGVVVWAPDSAPVKNGDRVWIWEESHIRNTFTIERPQGGGRFEVDQWRDERFRNDQEAKAFQTQFAPVKDTWAESGRTALPVRERADSSSDRVYRLGDGEITKVLSVPKPPVKEGNLEGSWIQVLTKDGYQGWVFDYYMSLYKLQDGKKVFAKSSGGGSDLIQTVLAKNWYPDEMRQMLDEHRINLSLFRNDAGLRYSQAPPEFQLVLPHLGGPDEQIILPVEASHKLTNSLYSFGGPNQVKVQFTNTDGSRMNLEFQWQGQTRSVALSLLDQNVSSVISDELALRQTKLQELLSHGMTLTSPTYGTIALHPDGTFLWTNFQIAVPQASSGTGQIVFDWFNKKLFNDFRAVRFQFGSDSAYSQVFLYRFVNDGLQLMPAASTDLDPASSQVLNIPRAGMTYFFTFGP